MIKMNNINYINVIYNGDFYQILMIIMINKNYYLILMEIL